MKISTEKLRNTKKKRSSSFVNMNIFEKINSKNIDHIVLAFEDNHYAKIIFGAFDENLSYIEKRLGLDIHSRGNTVLIRGEAKAAKHAQCVLDQLCELAKTRQELTLSDTESAIVMANLPNEQQKFPQTTQSATKRVPARLSTYKTTIHARTPTQDYYMRAMENAELIFAIGPAGTGKTYLAVAHAAMLLERGIIERIILSRPAVEAGEHLGFLPGDLKEKVDPYLRPLYDALYDMMPAEKVERVLASGIIEIAPLAFMRGRTLAHSAIILDEAQNTTPMQMKMFLTRFGEGSRMIITGDVSQIDLPRGQKSGLVEATHILSNIENIAIVRFDEKDVVRHPLVASIVNAYDRDSNEQRQTYHPHVSINKMI
ncbi:PhoH family protein [Bartonella bacilliformis]|uniref:PhoH-like protein n=2 Tax=Bartonella bacilliformis TaxID=774 RepID=A1UU40_BARBK|nr:PhoH family protein [Bartonella bacilliformis]ABM45079.1 PhoH family protein [Bartonella bacilliformis KC583]AMG86223.1 PhoH family protein [Bartonella bacilliformis]KZM38373.1 phosphate starvation-inducible protein PhoH [Bartonella bacilliformis]KZN22382.1 phosphate starvation-inducible protein PhoH [Bartonella bacilliformis]QFZ90786.1 AAA family ATPase [Bartonella bacilliformis]